MKAKGKKTKGKQIARKSYLTTLWLSLFLGIFGADRFYLGKWRTGILKLITAGGFFVWLIIDAIRTGIGKVTDSKGQKLLGQKVNVQTFKLSGLLLLATLLVSLVFDLLSMKSTANTHVKPFSGGEVFIIYYLGFGPLLGWTLFLFFTIVDAWRRNDWLWTIINVLSFFFIFGLISPFYYFFVRNKTDDGTL